VAYCQTDQIVRGSLNPFRYWLRQYFGQSQARPAGENRRAFARRFAALRDAVASRGAHGARLAAELVRTRAFLAALVDLHAPDALYESLDARSRFENILLALTALLQAESLRQPVILHIEDAHWLDEDSAQYLADLVRLLASEEGGAFPVALIATARPAAEPLLLDSARPFEELYLSAFGASDLAGLAAETLGAPAAQELLDFVAPRAEGNPLFAGQILQYLQEQAALEQDVAGWRLRPGVAAEAFVPGDIQALLVARLDRLTAAVRSVVQTAAVLGREFEVRVLSAMLRDDPQLPKQLDVAERAAIWSALDALRYLFTHALVRDAAYEMQVQAHRVELHHLAASGIETVYSADLPPHYADLAYHFGQAGDATAERRYARLAGERAAGQFANAEAARFLSRALALTPAADSSERYNLLAALERVHDLQGLREEQGKDLSALAAEAGALGDPEREAEATLRLANLARVTGDYATALAHVDAITAGAMAGVEARAALQRAQVLLHLGEYGESRRWLRRALRSAESSGARALVAQALYQIGLSYYYQERFAEALDHFQQAQPIYREIADRRGEINSMLMFGTVQSRQGSHMAARAMLNEALELCRATGWRHGETFILGNLANSYFDLGDYDTTRQLHEAALALSREVGDREGEAASLSTLALVAHHLGDPVRALALYRQAWQIQRAIGDRRGEGYTLTGMGHALADADDLEQAATVFSAALVLRRELEPDSPLAVDDVVGLADVALRRGDFHTAARYAVEAASWLETHDATGIESPILAWLICYRALVATAGEDAAATARASTCLARGHALLQQQAESIHDEALRQHFLVSVPSNRELLSLWEKATPA
jgi:tetratricopeptide (TPR) repeat protein